MSKILLAGESWMTYTTHVKGFDSFYTSSYESGEKWLKEALEQNGHTVDFLPNHLAAEEFPYTMEELSQYDCLILSDIGANTLLLSRDTFMHSRVRPNRCELIKNYVLNGGALLMIGGYLTFSGIDAKGRWGETPVQDVLPVKVLNVDDREEHPEGSRPEVTASHPALEGIKGQWPLLLGYNKVIPLEDAEVSVMVGNDPLIAFAKRGKGRSAVFTSDCAPHWGSPEFMEWDYYGTMWNGMIRWLTEKDNL